MFVVGLFFGIALGIIIREVHSRYTIKVEEDWEVYDAISAKWTIERDPGVITDEKFAWYEIHYSPSKDYYKLEVGGYDPKQHKMYNEVVKTLRENNKMCRERKEKATVRKAAGIPTDLA